MGHHLNYLNLYYDYSLPSFLESPNSDISITNEDIIIELGEGEYTLDFNIGFNLHNVIIKGCGRDKTILIIPENIDFNDDAIINLHGKYEISQGTTTDNRISVSFEGLTIRTNVSAEQVSNTATRLTQKETYLIKCYNVDSFFMRDVRIIAENLATTCIDIRRGFNIDIRNCEFINRNRRWTGGNIWLRGDIENVIIEENDFYKYGNDEVIGIFDTNNFVGVNNSDTISKKNINIRFNRFYCQDYNGHENLNGIIPENGDRGTWDGCNQRFITCFINQDSNKEKINGVKVQRSTPCHQTINGIHFDNNEFHINAPLSHLFTMAFDKYTTYKDVTTNNNIINYGTWTLDGNESAWKELMDFSFYYDTRYASSVIDGDYDGFCDELFYVAGNTITCGTNIRNTDNGLTYYQDNHICIDIKGTKVKFINNNVKCSRETYSADEHDFARKGIEIIHFGEKGGEVIMTNNKCEGLRCLSCLTSSGNPIEHARLLCCGNYLQGDTRIMHHNILESHEFMVNNEFICDYPIFFIQEFANNGTAVFTGNRIFRDLSRVTHYTTTYGHIYYTNTPNSNNNIQSMKFICCDNIFDNLSSQNIYSYLQSGSMRMIHKNNIFTDFYE